MKRLYDVETSPKIIPISVRWNDSWSKVHRICVIVWPRVNFFRAIQRSIRHPFPVTPRLISSWKFDYSLFISHKAFFPNEKELLRLNLLLKPIQSDCELSLHLFFLQTCKSNFLHYLRLQKCGWCKRIGEKFY